MLRRGGGETANANEKPDNSRKPRPHNECPNYAEPAVRVATSQAEQRAKCSRE